MNIYDKLKEPSIALPPVAAPAAAYTPFARAGDLLFLSVHLAKRDGRIVKLVGLVNSTSDFREQHLVTNGASELLSQVFGDAGMHARSAFGVAQIPMGACVEIELIAQAS